MKFIAIILAVAFVVLFLQNVATQTNRRSAMVLPSPFIVLTNQNFQLSKTFPISLSDAQTAQPLKPGIYQTYPYAIVLIVPEPVNDNCKIEAQPNIDSKMRIFQPKIEVVPKSSVAK
jgi:hypothetical protein